MSSPQMSISFSTSKAVRAKRESKRDAIREFFLKHLGSPMGTTICHELFGPSFRSRLSELNRDPNEQLRVRNVTTSGKDGIERSVFVSEIRGWRQ
jgi:hypothetical protein